MSGNNLLMYQSQHELVLIDNMGNLRILRATVLYSSAQVGALYTLSWHGITS